MCRLFELNDHGRNFSLSHLPQELRSLEEVGPQKCLVFSTDGSRFATGGVDGHLRLHEWPGMRTIVDESEAHNSVNDMDFSLDSRYLASIYTDGSLRIWDTDNGGAVKFMTRPGSPDKFELCRFSRDRTKPYLFCTLQEGYRPATVIWDICTWNIIGVKDLRKHACVMSISTGGSYIALFL
ncbi:putative transcription factor WD40-like family [Helianthus debilis subsp. tardiflorus]